MPLFALVQGTEVLRVQEFNTKPGDLPAKGWKWKPVEEQRDSFDPDVHALEDPVAEVKAGKVVIKTKRRNKTPEEIAEHKAMLHEQRNPEMVKEIEDLKARVAALEAAVQLAETGGSKGKRA